MNMTVRETARMSWFKKDFLFLLTHTRNKIRFINVLDFSVRKNIEFVILTFITFI